MSRSKAALTQTYKRADRAIKTINLISDRWALTVLTLLLYNGVMRYSELEATIDGISPGVLTRTLRTLERRGLIERKVYVEIPLRVEYTITDLGLSLDDPLTALCEWYDEHGDSVEAAVAHYDAKPTEDH